MAECKDCLSNCDPQVTDKCIKYTNNAYASLGICKGMSLFEVEKIILDKLDTVDDGTGIVLADLESCAYIDAILAGKEATVYNVVQALLTSNCDINTRIVTLEDILDTPFSFDTACLTGTLTTRDQILQAVITLLCNVNTRLTTVESEYVKQSDLCTQVAACLAGTTSQFNARMVPYAPIPYIGPLSNFDNTGKGIVSAGFEKVYLMNGLNGTQDWRGRSPIGAIQNVPGTTLDSTVNPALPANSAYNYVVNQKYGASTDTLTVQQSPAHTHSVVDPQHEHFIVRAQTVNGDDSVPIANNPNNTIPSSWYTDNNDEYSLQGNGSSPANAGKTNKISTGITIGTSGANQAHNSLHPVIGTYFIIYLP